MFIKILVDAKVFHRSPLYAKDDTPSIVSVQEFLNSTIDVENIALIQTTSPFLREGYLKQAIEKFETKDCVFSATRSFKLRWQVADDGKLKAINFNPAQRPRRQDWSGELIENGMFYFTSRALVQSGIFQNDNCDVVEITWRDSIEIDGPHDLKLANAMLEF